MNEDRYNIVGLEAEAESCKVKHTPGPWKVTHPFIIRDELDAPCGIVASVRRFGDSEVMQWIAPSPASLENVANARLIAAAPDLLAACRSMAACFSDEQLRCAGCYGLLMAAIARATGEVGA